MPLYTFEGRSPTVDPGAFIAPTATLVGDVHVEVGASVWFNAVLRADFAPIIVRQGANVQDCCVLHSFPSKDTLLEEDAHIGHGAVLHGCTIRRGALIGIGAIVMDDAVVEEEAFVGAASFVRAGFVVPRRTLVTGVPARIVRTLTPEELAWKATGTREYQELAQRCLATLKECQPLAAPEANRPTTGSSSVVPLHSIERPKDLLR